jgi:hypothetical protein
VKTVDGKIGMATAELREASLAAAHAAVERQFAGDAA